MKKRYVKPATALIEMKGDTVMGDALSGVKGGGNKDIGYGGEDTEGFVPSARHRSEWNNEEEDDF